MLMKGILNPQLNSLLSRVRHTNLLVIADRGFPFWPQVETVDLALTDDIPTVLDVLRALQPNFQYGRVWMASEFREHNSTALAVFEAALQHRRVEYELHAVFKLRVPTAIGLIRTADTLPYANVILESE